MNTQLNPPVCFNNASSESRDTNISNISNLSPQPPSSSSFIEDIESSPGHDNECIHDHDDIGYNRLLGTIPDASPRPLIDSSSLNRSNLAELLRNLASLDPYVIRYLGLVEQKVQYFPQRFRDPDYLAHSSILIASRFVSSRRYAHCCRPNMLN